VHAIEIQHAGYLLSEAMNGLQKKFKLIVTNWGSDLFFYSEIVEHRNKIKSLLSQVDFYSAECRRDYLLAIKLGYKGSFLPLIPNAGGFLTDQVSRITASERRLILVKSNGGTFGNITEITPVIIGVLSDFQEYSVHFYSVTADVQKEIEAIRKNFPDRVTLSTSDKRLNHSEMLNLFGKARVYLASSKSDGISTSFLEALISGAYPIQSNTSCANEWIDLGFRGSIVTNNYTSFDRSLRKALASDDLVNSAQVKNLKLAKLYLDKELISKIASNFYDENYLSSISANDSLEGDKL
jgi:glycosyltransferase involved in cell wall biosynthesis